MDQLPDFWRTELWHALSVHFPIALLTFATLFYAASLALKKQTARLLRLMAGILLLTGVVAAWISIYTGNAADGAVARTLCDPTVLKKHETGAYTSTIIFSVAALLFILQQLPPLHKGRKALQFLILTSLLAGSGYLVYAGHLGASVVYQQGAGVFRPSDDCREFD